MQRKLDESAVEEKPGVEEVRQPTPSATAPKKDEEAQEVPTEEEKGNFGRVRKSHCEGPYSPPRPSPARGDWSEPTVNYENQIDKASATGSNPTDSGRPFPLFKPIPHKKWEQHFMEATEHDMIALRLVDVHERNAANVEPLIHSLEGAVEIYVLLWGQTLGLKARATVRIPSLKFFKAGRDLTFRESNRQNCRQNSLFRNCISIDEGYRTVIALAPKTAHNLRVLRGWMEKKGVGVPEFYRRDFEDLNLVNEVK